MSKHSSDFFPLKGNNFEGELEDSIFLLIGNTVPSKKIISQDDTSTYVPSITIEQQETEPVINEPVSVYEDESVHKSYLKIAAMVMLCTFLTSAIIVLIMKSSLHRKENDSIESLEKSSIVIDKESQLSTISYSENNMRPLSYYVKAANDAFQILYKSEEFLQGNLETKVSLTLEELNQLSENDIIRKETIFYFENSDYIFFEYFNGSIGMADISISSDFPQEYDDEVIAVSSQNSTLDAKKQIDSTRESENILIIGDFVQSSKDQLESSNLFCTFDEKGTLDILANDLYHYDFVGLMLKCKHFSNIQEYFPKITNQNIMFTAEHITAESINKYNDDIQKNNLIIYNSPKGCYFAIGNDFFYDHYHENNKLKNTIIYIGGGESADKDSIVSEFMKLDTKVIIYSKKEFPFLDSIRCLDSFIDAVYIQKYNLNDAVTKIQSENDNFFYRFGEW